MPHIIHCMLNNIGTNSLRDILDACTSLYKSDKGHFVPIVELVVRNFEGSIPTKLRPNEIADLYCYGFGSYYHFTGKDEICLRYLDEAIEIAIEINRDHVDAWFNKGVTLVNLGRYEDAIESYDKAIMIKPDFHLARYNKGVALANLGY